MQTVHQTGSSRTRRLRIGLVHRADARDIRSWSGIFYFMAQSLQKHVGDVVYLGPDRSRKSRILFGMIWRMNKAVRPLLRSELMGEANRLTSRQLANFFERRIKDEQVDVIFAPVASTEIAYLHTDTPIVYLSDITWKKIVNYYPSFSRSSAVSRREADLIEARAIQIAAAAVYPSEWAAESAREDYHAACHKVFTIPFGANFQETPCREDAINHGPAKLLNLLWLGVDWHRKGADIAVDCLQHLLEAGIDARLTICGCNPPAGFSHPRVRVIPFLNKHDLEQRKKLTELFLESHFFIFPTRAEALGVVIAEASAHGLPTIGADTGGVQGVLRDGQNGALMPPEADGAAYAEKIKEIWSTPAEYARLVHGSRELFERELNWDAWGRSIREVFLQVTDGSGASTTPAHLSSQAC